MSDEHDILSQVNAIDLSKVETGFPILDSGLVQATILKCEMRRDTEKKGDAAKPYCYVEFALSSPHKTVAHEGPSKVINPGDRGSTFNERIYVGKYTDKQSGEEKWYGIDRLAKLREAAIGKAAPGTNFNPQELISLPITLRLKFDPAPKNKDTGEVYGPRTNVDAYVKKA